LTPVGAASKLTAIKNRTRRFDAGNRGKQEGSMSGTIINLIIQLIAGAIGGNAVGRRRRT
jgi:hypothetical protein